MVQSIAKRILKKLQNIQNIKLTIQSFMQKNSLDGFMKQNHAQIDSARKQFEDYFVDLVINFENLLEGSHKAEHSLGQMESLKPLVDLINGKFDSATSIVQIIIILDMLYLNVKNKNLGNSSLLSDIKKLKETLLDFIGHV